MKPFTHFRAALLSHAFFCFVCLLGVAPPVVAASDEVPAWLRQAAAQSAPAYPKEVTAVVLHDESKVSITEDGRVTATTLYAVRLLTRAGRDEAFAVAPYLTDTGKIRDMRAWLIRSSGEVKRYGKDETADVADLDNDVYSEARSKRISARAEADAGCVFGYEYTHEYRSAVPQLRWYFQGSNPVLFSRFAVTLPAGWNANGFTFNHPKVEPIVAGTTYTWEVRNLPFIKREPSSPSVRNLAPRLAVNYFPASGGRFSKWDDVSRWLTQLTDAQAAPSEALATKARELTHNVKTDIERIERIARYVQKVQYVSVQIDIARGGGYKPHAAADVFAKNYGDCKDKANLMRAMLKAIGIEAYLMPIYWGDRTYVRADFPSPGEFNHCIVAVRVGEDVQLHTVVQHPTLGRLLVFDPTDEFTAFGDLPEEQQGSFALLVAGDAGTLLKMPVAEPSRNRQEMLIEASLVADGSLTARLSERSRGQQAANERRMFRSLSPTEYKGAIEGWITRYAAGAAVSKITPADLSAEHFFNLDVDFTIPRYGQVMNNRLMVFRPAILGRRHALDLSETTRNHPLVLDAQAFTDTVRVKLPAGFAIDELPEATKIDAGFGSFRTAYEQKDGDLIFTRTLSVQGITVPAEQYATVRDFYSRIFAADQAPVVLAKQ